MRTKIKICVYGIKDQAVGGGTCGTGSCQAAPTIGELYAGLETFLEQSDVGDLIELTFIDIFQTGTGSFAVVEDYMDRGFNLPITSIDDRKFFHSGMYNQLIYETVKELLAEEG